MASKPASASSRGKANHNPKGQNFVIKIQDIYGIMLLLAIGLSGALLVATVEYIFLNKVVKHIMNNYTRTITSIVICFLFVPLFIVCILRGILQTFWA